MYRSISTTLPKECICSAKIKRVRGSKIRDDLWSREIRALLKERAHPIPCQLLGHPGERMIELKTRRHSLHVMSPPLTAQRCRDVPLIELDGSLTKGNWPSASTGLPGWASPRTPTLTPSSRCTSPRPGPEPAPRPARRRSNPPPGAHASACSGFPSEETDREEQPGGSEPPKRRLLVTRHGHHEPLGMPLVERSPRRP